MNAVTTLCYWEVKGIFFFYFTLMAIIKINLIINYRYVMYTHLYNKCPQSPGAMHMIA
jgi:hypothetical protein